VRGPKRELISRGYNTILHTALRTRFSDAQCGFKAVRTAALHGLIDEIRDDGWFFDTELLVLAQRRGLRIHEVPVDWVEDPDSKVHLASTAAADLRGVARLGAQSQFLRFVAIGVASTAAYVLLYLALRSATTAAAANAIALAGTAIANTAANRRFTFGVRGRARALYHQLLGGLVFLLALGLTTGALALLNAADAHPRHITEAIVLVVASIVATLSRYVCLRWWVFASRPHARRAGLGAPPRAA
jgi:putative flippase GtrA